MNSPFRFLYLFNYPEFKEICDKQLIGSYSDRNVRYTTDKKAIEENIIYLGRQLKWELIEDGSTSRIYREFSFSNKEEVLDFITLIAPKCEEIDHHPEWFIGEKSVKVNLTSHFLSNKVSNKDYHLALLIEEVYSKGLYLTKRENYFYVRNALGMFLISFVIYMAFYFNNAERNYRIGGTDYFSARIDMKSSNRV